MSCTVCMYYKGKTAVINHCTTFEKWYYITIILLKYELNKMIQYYNNFIKIWTE